MEDLRLTFLIFGIVVIVAILVHGLWTIRKNAKGNEKPTFESRDWQNKSEPKLDDTEQFDAHGFGSVRVVSSKPQSSTVADADVMVERDVHHDEHDEFDDAPYPKVRAEATKANTASHENADAQINSSDDSATELNDSDDVYQPTVASNNQTAKHTNTLGSESEVTPAKGEVQVGGHTGNNAAEHANEHADAQAHNSGELSLDDGLSLASTEMDFTQLAQEHEQEAPKPLYGNVVTQPKPGHQRAARTPETAHRHSQNQDNSAIPEPPPFLLKSAAASPEVNPDADHISKRPVEQQQEQQLKSQPQQNTDTKGRVEPEFKLDAEHAPVEPAKPISLAAQARRLVSRRKKSVADVIRKEPDMRASDKLNEEQMRIDFSNEEPTQAPSPSLLAESDSLSNQTPTTTQQATASSQGASNSQADEQATDVLVLNVKAPEDREISGATLLPMLLTLGLKFGEQDIFHRHVNTNGKGPVLFSLANLFKPGVFDIDNIETFSTRGLSLFMMLPIEGDPQQVFNMMHNAARKLADEFNCQILDGSRGVLTKQGLQKYSERIRDFERKRINR